MDKESFPYQMISDAVGISTKIVSNEFNEFHGNAHHKIIFTLEEDEPNLLAFGVLFTLSLMSFTFSAPRGYSEKEFIPDEEWSLEYFMQNLRFKSSRLIFDHSCLYFTEISTGILPGTSSFCFTRIRKSRSSRSSFIFMIKEKLGIKAKGREVAGEKGSCVLREPAVPYDGISGHENDALRPANAYF